MCHLVLIRISGCCCSWFAVRMGRSFQCKISHWVSENKFKGNKSILHAGLGVVWVVPSLVTCYKKGFVLQDSQRPKHKVTESCHCNACFLYLFYPSRRSLPSLIHTHTHHLLQLSWVLVPQSWIYIAISQPSWGHWLQLCVPRALHSTQEWRCLINLLWTNEIPVRRYIKWLNHFWDW